MPDITNVGQEQKLVKVKVAIDTHTHQGKPCKNGEEIEVEPAVAEMLTAEWAKQQKKQQ